MSNPGNATAAFANLEPLSKTSHGRLLRGQRVADEAAVVLKQRSTGDVCQQRQALQRELDALQRLDSPLVVKGWEVCDVDGTPSLVCDVAAGADLSRGPLPLAFDELLHVAQEVARALSHLHERGVVHNDIKPSNLIYDSERRALTVVDFDVASVANSAPCELSGVEGSLPYLSPERTGRMNRLPDYRADFYSLGVTLFELASGRLPFEANDALGWAHAHLSKTAPLLCESNPAVPEQFGNLVAKLLAKDPEQRYQSAFGLLTDLRRCAEAWAEGENIPPFTLGQSDISQAFKVSRVLVGRGDELRACSRALEDARAGAARLLLISAAAGMGKTRLVREFSSAAQKANATTLYAAFEQHNQGRPYSALVSALEELVTQALAQSESSLSDLCQRLNGALGSNTSVIAEFVPKVERILGPQGTPPAVNPPEAKHRLQGVVRAFLRAFVAPSHPLVLVLDDCQWLDVSTAEMLKELVSSGEVPHLVLTLAYRSELGASHPLTELLTGLSTAAQTPLGSGSLPPPRSELPMSIRWQPTFVREVWLGPLGTGAIAELLSASLRSTAEPVEQLALVLHEKTDGNPFFINELLETLSADALLSLDGNTGKWRWDLPGARALQVSANVADLVAQRMDRLGPAVRTALGAAACLGLQFTAAAVASVSGLSRDEASSALRDASRERLVTITSDLANGEGFVFPHTRVLEAAYASVDAATKAKFHRQLGTELLQRWNADPNSIQLFDVLHHLNLAASVLSESEDLMNLLRLNLEGAARARRTAAFDVARAHADIAADLSKRCAVSPELAFQVRFCQAEAVYLSGAFETAWELCDGCFEFASTPLFRARIHALKARIADHQAQLLAAIGEIRAGLKALDVTLPESHTEIDQAIGPGLGKMMGHLGRMAVEELADLPTAQSPETALILELLMQVVPPSIQTYPPLFIVAELMMFDIEMAHGVTAVSCKNFVDCGILQASILGNHDTAYRLGQVAFKLLERFRPTPLEAAVNFVFAGFVSHWKAHFQEAELAYETVKRIGIQLGDMQHVAYAYAHHTQRSIYVGRPLADCATELEVAVDFLTRSHHLGPLVGTVVAERAIARLCAQEGNEAEVVQGDAEATARVLSSKNAQWGYSYGQGQTAVSYFLRDMVAARHWQAFTKPFSLAAASLFSVPDYHLFDALVELWATNEDPTRREDVLAATQVSLGKLETWAKAAPDNFSHKYELLRAERDRVAGEPLHVVLDGYQRAVAATGQHFPQFRALANELEAELWLGRGDARRAKPALEEAYRLYAEWGATAKLRQLEHRHGWLKGNATHDEASLLRSGTTTTTTTSNNLDTASILKATQAISKEVETQKLFAALMSTLIESAGAEHGCLVLESDIDQQCYVEARAHVDDSHQGGNRESLSEARGVCTSVVRYVFRTREAVTLDDAANAGTFKNDTYIKEQGVRSLLCVPILRQGQILGALYLENNQTTHAFTRERVGLLQVIASQAAISIYNAQLYSSLERRVKERTAELAQKNRQIATMLDNMDQGVFTIDQQLAIQPGYSRYLERVFATTDIVGKHCMQLLFQGSNVRPDVLLAADGALQFSFGVESWLAAANAPHLIREFQRPSAAGEPQFLEVDWNFICDDNDIVEKVLIVVRDVTVLRQLQLAAAQRGQEADIVTEVIETGVEAFDDFARTARDFLEQNSSAVGREDGLSPDVLAHSFRNLHTLKGNARLLGYTHLVDVIHAAEERYDTLRKNPNETIESEVLLAAIERVKHSVELYARVSHTKLSKLTHGHDQRLAHVLRDISQLVQGAQTSANTNALADVARMLRRLDGTPFAELLMETSRLVPSLASELGKAVPSVECRGDDMLLTKDWTVSLRDILVQCLRNSLFHGIETDAVRQAQGKPKAGKIRVDVVRAPTGFHVYISDDGRGLALSTLRETRNLPGLSDEQLAEFIFESGVSTAKEVGLVAGRGVGLDIVRALLRNSGGDVSVQFTGTEQAGYRPFALVLALPEVAVLELGNALDADQSETVAA